MPNSISEQLVKLRESLEGKTDEILQAIKEIENSGNLSIKDELLCEAATAGIHLGVGSFGDAIRITRRLYKKGKMNKIPLAMIDALSLRFFTMWVLGDLNYGKLWEIIGESENLIKDASQEPKEDIEYRNALIDFEKASIYRNIGDLDLALDNCNKALKVSKKDKRMSSMMPTILMEMGKIYYVKGELEKSEDFLLESIPLYKDTNLTTQVGKIYALWCLGDTYRSQGKLDLSIETYKNALALCKNINIAIYTGVVYTSLIEAYIDKKSLNDATEILNRFKDYNTQNPFPANNWLYKISEARILKSSGRIQNLAEAEKILRQFIEGIGPGSDLNYAVSMIIDLCHILLIELQITDEIEIMDEFESLITQLLDIAEKQHSYTTLTSTKLLQGKLALIQLNIEDARRFLAEAQQIADEHGLQKLAHSISREHDKLLEQLDIWENLDNTKATISERLKLASMDETMEYLQAKRITESHELINEEPILILITAEGGTLLFSNTFAKDLGFEEELISSFLTAFDSFSGELFSKGLDRAKFGEYTILLESIGSFSVGYLFKGETYFAIKKLNQFSENIHNNESIWQTLNKFYQTNQVLEINDLPSLGNLINEIFIN